MPKTVKYIGTVTRWPELATTGKQSAWVPGQQEQRSDTEAAQLLATGLFSDVDATQLPEQKVVAISGVVSEAGIGPLEITAPTGYVLGATLTATTNAGWVVGGYQWTRDGADIAGATSSTYTLTLADVQMPHLPPSVIGCRAVSPVYTYLALVPVGTFPDGYLSLNNGALSLNDGLLSLV